MGKSDILKEAGKSALGIIEKAYIEIEDNRVSQISVVEGKNNMYDVSFSDGSFVGSFSKNELSAVAKSIKNSPKYDGMTKIKRYIVRFNPSTISINAYGGGRIAKTSFDGNEAKTVYEGLEATIAFNVQLIFDAESNEDCFMNEVADIKGNIKKGVNVVRKKRYSVQNQVEGFIAALRSPYTRRVTFSWGNLSYRGVLTDVDAEYTMFSIHGRPVRAVVHLGMMCTDADIAEDNMGQWKKNFEKAFSSNKTNLESVSQNVGNLLNINL